MIKYLLKYRALFASVFVLAPLMIWFSYSELGPLVGVGETDNSAQDFCEVVMVTKAETGKTLSNNIFKLKVDNAVCMQCVDELSLGSIGLNKSVIERFYFPQKSSTIYLFNSTFLI